MAPHVRGKYVPEVWMTVDPGQHTGYATWSEDWKLLRHGILHSKKESLADRCEDIASQLSSFTKLSCMKKVYFEFPAFFASAGGQVTASSGALVKLVFLVGWLSSTVRMHVEVDFVTVNEWKGTLPKDIVWKRIMKRLPDCTAKSHSLDAVGIGLYKAGRF